MTSRRVKAPPTSSSSPSSESESECEEEEEGEEGEEGEEESSEPRSKLRARKEDDYSSRHLKRERLLLRRLTRIFKKSPSQRSELEVSLLSRHPECLSVVSARVSKQLKELSRREEKEDPPPSLEQKIKVLSEAIEGSQSLVVYTGAGISTSANIPDYRGPNGVWTRLEKGLVIEDVHLEASIPTATHLSLLVLHKRGKLKHIVSQNCDGLHLRSGIPRHNLSELHGNMFIEICKRCKPNRPFVRLFDVTERTSKHRHLTKRRCYVCGHSLSDTIVHFGERGSLKWPLNWEGASKAAKRADVILCLGSSLKVLRRYPWLWCMDKPKRDRPQLFIVNLQWTPKDKHATLKINGRCDEVMKGVFDHLGLTIPTYYPLNDPLLSFGTRLNPLELHTTSRVPLPDLPHIVEERARIQRKEAVEFDHNYAPPPPPTKEESRKRRRPLDFKSCVWPRDALYLTYENRFEFMEEANVKSYPCDCCDPAKNKRQSNEDSSLEEESDESESKIKVEPPVIKKEEEDGFESSKKGIKLEEDCNDEKPPKASSSTKPGWFGKGRRKRIKA